MTLPDGRIGHAELAIGIAVISVGLAWEPVRDVGAPVTRTTLRTMTLVFVDDVDEAVAKGTRYGGSIIDPPTDQPWGLRQAVVCDPGGYLWEPSRHLRDVPPDSWGAKQFGPLPGADHN
jgi:PhnB protein